MRLLVSIYFLSIFFTVFSFASTVNTFKDSNSLTNINNNPVFDSLSINEVGRKVVLNDTLIYGTNFGTTGLANTIIGKYTNRQADYRFRARFSGSVTQLRVYLIYAEGYSAGTGGKLKITLESDDGTLNHFPSGTVLAEIIDEDPMRYGGKGSQVLYTFNNPANLIEGNLYHLRFTNPDKNPNVNYISIDELYSPYGIDDRLPSMSEIDLALLVRELDSDWELSKTHTPIYTLYFSNGQRQGQGYIGADVNNPRAIEGSKNKVRSHFKLSNNDKTVTKVWARVRKISGDADLKLRLETYDGNLLEQGLIPSTSFSENMTWNSYTFSSPQYLKATSTYFLTLSTDSGTVYETYSLQDGYFYNYIGMFEDGHFEYTTNGSDWNDSPNPVFKAQVYFEAYIPSKPYIVNNQDFNIDDTISTDQVFGKILVYNCDNLLLNYLLESKNDNFHVDPNTGDFSVHDTTGISVIDSLTISVIVKANEYQYLADTAKVILRVNHIENETEPIVPGENNPPQIENQQLYFYRNADTSNMSGFVIAYDPDLNQNISYSIIGGNDEDIFEINHNTGLVTVYDTIRFFFNGNSEYDLLVEVHDDGVGTLSDSANISISAGFYEAVFYINPLNFDDTIIDGTKDHPFQHWDEVTWIEGATYLQNVGTISELSKIEILTANVTIGSYGTGDMPVIKSNTNDYVIICNDKHNVTLKNINIVSDNADGCIYINGANSKNFSLINCKLEGAKIGMRIIDGASYSVNNSVFINKVTGIYSHAITAQIHYNLFKGNSLAIYSCGNSKTIKILNNVFYDNRLSILSSLAEVELYNNIFYLTNMEDKAINQKIGNLISNNNIFYPERPEFITIESNPYNYLLDFQRQTGNDKLSLTLDPLFIDRNLDNFSLSEASKAIDSGKPVGLKKDFFNKTVPSGGLPDIGYCEVNRSAEYEEKYNPWIVYPNPSTGIFHLRYDQDYGTEAEIIISTITGKRVSYNKLIVPPYSEYELDLSNNHAGIYIIVIYYKEKRSMHRLVVL